MTFDFWFDYHSPWAYLAATQIEVLARRHERRPRWRPLHLPRLISTINGRRPLEDSASFVRWYQQDLQDWAAIVGVTISYHPAYPLRPARALRATLFAEPSGAAGRFALAVFRAYWSGGVDISDLGQLAAIGQSVGLDGAAVAAAAETTKWKSGLDANTAEAEATGVFGVPTVNCDGKLFFGNDRLAMLDYHLGGAAPPVFARATRNDPQRPTGDGIMHAKRRGTPIKYARRR